MRKIIKFNSILFLLIICIINLGCNSTDSAETIEEEEEVQEAGESNFTAKVNGVDYSATEAYAGLNEDGDELHIVTSQNKDFTMELGIKGITEGTYSISGSTSDSGAGYGVTEGIALYTTYSNGSGEIILSELTSTRMVGTFSFEAGKISGDSDFDEMVEVTEGTFNVTRNSQYD